MSSPRDGRNMHIAALLCDRLSGSLPNTYHYNADYFSEKHWHQVYGTADQRDLDLLCSILKRKSLGWWD